MAKNRKLGALNYVGFSKVRIAYDLIKIVIESNLSDKEKVELINNHINSQLNQLKQEYPHFDKVAND